jgi:hypothetical protein
MERPLPTSAPPRPAAVPAGRRRSTPEPRPRRRSRRPIVALIVGAVVATALPVLGAPGAAAVAVPVTVAPVPAAVPAPTTPTVPAGPAVTVPAPAPGATFTVSREVDRFLVAGLGLPMGASATLTGTAAGSTITIDPALPRALPLGLPAGVAGPVFAGAHIVIDPAADTLTLTASAGGGADARLSVVVRHASTSTLAGGADLSATVHVGDIAVLGTGVDLDGPLSYADGTVTTALAGRLADDVVVSPAAVVRAGSTVTLGTATGLVVDGSAVLVAAAGKVPVSVRGRVTAPGAWTLAVGPPADKAEPWTPRPGLAVAPADLTGTITAAGGAVHLDVSARVPGPWTPAPGVRLHDARVELSDGPLPAGTAFATPPAPGAQWLVARGPADVGGTTGTASVAVDTATGAGRVAVTADGPVEVKDRTLTALSLAGDLDGPLTGRAVARDAEAAGPVGVAVALGGDGVLTVTGAADDRPAAPEAGDAGGAPSDPARPTVALSDGARRFLADTLHLPVTGDTLTGTPGSGDHTVTLTLPAPGALPVMLPAGVGPLTFGPTTVVADLGADTVTLTADAAAADGTAAHLTVTLAHASSTRAEGGADITASLGITGIAVLGTTVDLTGALAYDGHTLTPSLSGSLAQDVVLRRGEVTIAKGASVTLSAKDGLAVDGTVTIGSGTTAVTVTVTGAIRDTKNWSLDIASTTTRQWSPVDGLTLTPSFTGHVSSEKGAIGFDLAARNALTWAPGAGVSVAVTNVEVSNRPVPDGVTCPADLAPGALWIDAAGDLTYSPGAGRDPLAAHVDACIAPIAKAFSLTTAVTTGGLAALPQIGLDQVTLTATGGAGRPFVVAGSARLTAPSVSADPFVVGLRFGADGSFIGTVAVPDLSKVGFTGHGALFVSSADIDRFDPASIPGLTGVPFHLHQGLNVTLDYTLPAGTRAALNRFGLRLGDQTAFQAAAALGPKGFALAVQMGLGRGTDGAKVLDTGGSSPVRLYLNDVTVELELGTAAQSVNLSTTGTLTTGALSGQTGAGMIQLRAAISVDVAKLAFNARFSLSGACAVASCPWTDAFGVPGLTVGALGGGFGVTFETAVPTPSVAISAEQISLPPSIRRALGVQDGATFTLNLNVDATSPLLELGLAGSPALKPLAVVRTASPTTVDSLRINAARFVLAPFGGTTAAGKRVDPGASVLFDAVIGGVLVHADVAVNLAAATLDGTFHVDGFAVGTLQLNDTNLHLHVAPTAFDFAFTGGFTDAPSHTTVQATVHVNATLTQAGGAVQLVLGAGRPDFLRIDGALNGTVSASWAGASISASGTGRLVVAGRDLGPVQVSYSSGAGVSWQQLGADADQVALAFRDAYHWSSDQVNAALAGLRFSDTQKVNALLKAFRVDKVVGTVNTLLYGNGAYWISSTNGWNVPQFVDVSGGSQSPNGPVIQWPLNPFNPGRNQQWYIVPTDGGWAELVNRNSGQCLSAGYTYTQPGAPLVQYPCFGGTNQQWYLGVYPGSTNLDGRKVVLASRTNSGLVADVTGGSPAQGTPLELWTRTGGWNQQFTFTAVRL